MAIAIIDIAGQANSPDRKVFMIDDESDVDKLPTTKKDGEGVTGRAAPFSMAVTNLGEIFTLGTDDIWRQW